MQGSTKQKIQSRGSHDKGASWKVVFGGLVEPISTTKQTCLGPGASRDKESAQEISIFLRILKIPMQRKKFLEGST